jgi:hypothetical protein
MGVYRVIGVGYDDCEDLRSLMDYFTTAKSRPPKGEDRFFLVDDTVEADSWTDAVAKYTRMYVEACKVKFLDWNQDEGSVLGLPRLFIESDSNDPHLGVPGNLYIPEWYREVKGEDVPMDVLEQTDFGFLHSDYLNPGPHIPLAAYTLGAAARSFVILSEKIDHDSLAFGQKLFEMTGDRSELIGEPGPSVDIEFTPKELATFAEHRRQIEAGWKWFE